MVNKPTKSTLGRELRLGREAAGLSLRALASAAEVSAAYIQKLEHDEVDAPSPRRLERLAAALDLDYSRLMGAAGYTVSDGDTTASPLASKLATASLTQVEERAVAAFIDHLTAQRDSNEGTGG